VILLTSKLLGGGAILFGWAKPVPVNFARLRRPKQDMLWVAAAGPASTSSCRLLALTIQMGHALGSGFASAPLMLMGAAGVFINVILMALNLIPLPPLDGGRIAVSLLPYQAAVRLPASNPMACSFCSACCSPASSASSVAADHPVHQPDCVGHRTRTRNSWSA